MSPIPITPSSSIGQIVALHPPLARMFEHVGIDYCCGGRRTLAEACATTGLDAATFAVLLEAAATLATVKPAVDAIGMTLIALADHIESTHHAYLRAELPALIAKAERVAEKHSWRDSRLPAVLETLRELADEMLSHMAKEEEILFPLVRALERDGATPERRGALAGPIRVMESEHDAAGDAVARLRELTDGFTPDADACNTHRALLAGLAQLEADLHEHVHKENNVLFPRALALESSAAS